MIIDRLRVAEALPAYELGDELGVGSFGLVLAARHRGLDRHVAVKVLAATDDNGAHTGFHAEARVLAALDHPHVVRVYDYVEHHGLRLIIMELLAGGTLTRRRAGMPAEAACAVGLAVADALDTAHRRGILHRDIKPDNILFNGDGLLKVTDFGIAKIVEGSAATASAIVGTAKYMAPEQGTGARLGPATDLYALGIVLYELFTGAPPFDPKLPAYALVHHHLTITPPVPAGVPGPVADVVMRALAKDPEARHPSAHAFALDLAQAAARGHGSRWASRSGILLRLGDEIREATERPAVPADGPSPDGLWGVGARQEVTPDGTEVTEPPTQVADTLVAGPPAGPPPTAPFPPFPPSLPSTLPSPSPSPSAPSQDARPRLSTRATVLACVAMLGVLAAAGGWALARAESRGGSSPPAAVPAAPLSVPSTQTQAPAQQTPVAVASSPAGGTPVPAPASPQPAAVPAVDPRPGTPAPTTPAPVGTRPATNSQPVVPDVMGLVLADASSRLKAAGFKNIPYIYDCYRSPDIGAVVRQVPRPGTRLPATSPVRLSLQAKDCATVANVTGMTLEVARATLRKIGFTNIPYHYGCLGSPAVGRVVRQSPAAGTSYGRSKPVSLELQANNC